MRQFGVQHDSYTLPIINQLYLRFGCDLRCGKMMHCVGIQMGFRLDVFFCNTMIEFYVKCGYISLARKLFDEMSLRDHVSWTSMIAGYVGGGDSMRAFDLFYEMRREVEPNFVTVITILQACSSCGDVVLGRQLHGYVLQKGLLIDKSVRNSLLRMYTCKGSYFDVETLFSEFSTDVVTWNTLLSFYISAGNMNQVVKSFNAMLTEVRPSVESLTLTVSALSKCPNLSQGQQLHCFALKTSLFDHIFLTCLMDLYSKCSDLDACFRLFNEVPFRNRNTITWVTLMSAFSENGQYDKALELFKQLRSSGVEMTAEIITSLLDVSTDTGALHMGKEVHGYCVRNLLFNASENISVLETSILNMYIKCGSISSARHTFAIMAAKDVVSWTSMIEGLGTYGLGHEALAHFDQMMKEGIDPNPITFLSILSACSHSGLTNEGCNLLYAMKWEFGLEPELNHYTCIVDLLGRSGKLKDALAVIVKMVPYPDSRIWGALLSACRVYMDRKIGEFAAKRLLELEPENVGYHIVLSNMQASAEQWTDVQQLRTTVTGLNSVKLPGWSCIDVR
ncbi:pentatricopeptide repeat-containing protein At1g11290, chloroplastic-like [Silene latifolia]|uniref:pentatricopeptide repeat-containing protein At1g11290, chloroplastic-like n=1 Tax=Silene latifolia TaxID=37657 RepID=UPI003D771052